MKKRIKILWTIFIICIVSAISMIIWLFKQPSESKETYSEQTKIETEKETKEEAKKENPYIPTKKYDGIYKFELKSDNGSGYTYVSKGAIQFENGICRAKYLVSNDSFEYDREYEGFCGMDKNEKSTFGFVLNNGGIEYKSSKTEKNLIFELKSEYDLAGCESNKLELKYVKNAEDIDEVLEQVLEEARLKAEKEEKEKRKKEEKDFKSSCKEYTFNQIARNPEKFEGTKVKLTGEVVQVLYGYGTVDLRVNITKEGEYYTYYTDTIYATYYPKTGEDKILEEDIITLYGTSLGEYSYTSTMGAQITLPLIECKYITIHEQ